MPRTSTNSASKRRRLESAVLASEEAMRVIVQASSGELRRYVVNCHTDLLRRMQDLGIKAPDPGALWTLPIPSVMEREA